MDQNNIGTGDYLDQLKQIQEHQTAIGQNQYIPTAPQPCPSCGRCPTCGKGGYWGTYPQYTWGGTLRNY